MRRHRWKIPLRGGKGTPSRHKTKPPFNRALNHVWQLTEYAAVMHISLYDAWRRSNYQAPGTIHKGSYAKWSDRSQTLLPVRGRRTLYRQAI